ncbi:hypothetical protein T492DRAFT_849280 [Pavlovales sp. CCMP2436]|nr:hypothetical protein T492DRAFT_849280 [Pavlovales sp. CCMP2436]
MLTRGLALVLILAGAAGFGGGVHPVHHRAHRAIVLAAAHPADAADARTPRSPDGRAARAFARAPRPPPSGSPYSQGPRPAGGAPAPQFQTPRSAKGWVSRRRGEEGSAPAPWRNKNRARNRAREWERLGDAVHLRWRASNGTDAGAGTELSPRAEELLARAAAGEPLSDDEAGELLAALPRERSQGESEARTDAQPRRTSEAEVLAASAAPAPDEPPSAPLGEPPAAPAAAPSRARWFEAVTFGGLSVGPVLKAALDLQNLAEPLPIQTAAFVPIRTGTNAVLVAAPTGSGKTLAIALPLLARLLATPPPGERGRVGGAFRALVLAPSAELAAQHARTLRRLLEPPPDSQPDPRREAVAEGETGGERVPGGGDRITVSLWTASYAGAAQMARSGSMGVAPAEQPRPDSSPSTPELQLGTIVVATPGAALQRLRAGLSAKCWARLSAVVVDEADAVLTLRTRTKGKSPAAAGAGRKWEAGGKGEEEDDDDEGEWDELLDSAFDGDDADGAAVDTGAADTGTVDTDAVAQPSLLNPFSRANRAKARGRKQPADELLEIIARKAPGGFAPASGPRLAATVAPARAPARAPPQPTRAGDAARPQRVRGEARGESPRWWDEPRGARGWDDEQGRPPPAGRAPPGLERARPPPPPPPPAQAAQPVQLILMSATVGRALRKAAQKLTGGSSIADAAAIVVPPSAELAGLRGQAASQPAGALMLPPQISHGYRLADAAAADGAVTDGAWVALVGRAWRAWCAADAAGGSEGAPAADGEAGGRLAGSAQLPPGRIAILFLRREDSLAAAARALREAIALGEGVAVRELRAHAAEAAGAGDGDSALDAGDAVAAALADAAVGRSTLLVASGHRARGLDVAGVGLVLVRGTAFSSAAAYVHCAGRTGRAGSSGRAVALISSAQAVAYARAVAVLGLRLRGEQCADEREGACPPP